jgi:hypothetical protein
LKETLQTSQSDILESEEGEFKTRADFFLQKAESQLQVGVLHEVVHPMQAVSYCRPNLPGNPITGVTIGAVTVGDIGQKDGYPPVRATSGNKTKQET